MRLLKFIKWILFTIVYGYSVINVSIFAIALIFNCINWNDENIIPEILKIVMCLIIVVLWHIDVKISYCHEKSLEDITKKIERYEGENNE